LESEETGKIFSTELAEEQRMVITEPESGWGLPTRRTFTSNNC
jgi:hypothetical protein